MVHETQWVHASSRETREIRKRTYKKPDDLESTLLHYFHKVIIFYCFLLFLIGVNYDGFSYRNLHKGESKTSRTKAPRSVVMHVVQGEKVCNDSIIDRNRCLPLMPALLQFDDA